MNIKKIEGTIFNIQHYSIHDGPGIRTTVFLKGCPLKCPWCQNPESQNKKPVLIFDAGKCTGCRACESVCPADAIGFNGDLSETDRYRCSGSGECARVCPNDARTIAGEIVTAGYVFEKIAADTVFYENSGGGVTLSGGDPLFQPDFCTAILKLCHQQGIHTALDTCGYAKWEAIKEILGHADIILYDFKHFDDTTHKRLTGVSNRRILENAKRIYHDLEIPILARLPIIPGYNDSESNMIQAAEFIAVQLDKSVPVHLIPYHKLGQGKLKSLEHQEIGFDCTPPDEQHLEKLLKFFSNHGLTAVIGG